MERMQKQAILNDLSKKMVFLTGPRQAGKTWLAKGILPEFSKSVYLNYDKASDRDIIKEEAWLADTELLVLDELHKMPDWKNYVKGVFDTKPDQQKILVTGSARLEIFRQVGDALSGRYFLHRLLPLSPAELTQLGTSYTLDYLLERGGFPEPFLAEDPVDAKRWRMQYIDSLLRDEVPDFENIQDLKAMKLVFELLRQRVGSSVSFSSIGRDVGVSSHTVSKYISIFESLYMVFRVTPYSNNIARSILKEPKIYFYDTGLVNGDEGTKFENLVAVSLLKHAFAKEDYKAERTKLHYLRTKDKQEVDFALIDENEEISKIIEVKLSDQNPSQALQYFAEKYNLPAAQIVKNLSKEYRKNNVDVVRAQHFLAELEL